jgi:LysM repeat protein
LAIFMLAVCRLAAADAPIAFSGFLTLNGQTRIALTDTSTNTTRWVEVGQHFNGYTLIRYLASDEAVIVRKDAQDVRLPLAAPQTTEPQAAPQAAPTIAAATPPPQPNPAQLPPQAADAIRNNLRQLVAAARRLQLERGVTTATLNDLVGPDKYISALHSVDGEDYSGVVITPETSILAVTTPRGEPVSLQLTGSPETDALPGAATPSLAAPAAPAATPDATADAGAAATPPPATPETATAPTADPANPTPPPADAPATQERIDASYVIQPGDTFERIGQATGLSVSQLQSLNPGVDPNAPGVGQTIRLR